MRYQDQLVRQTQKALDDIARAARAIPADRADWSPGGESRSALNQMQEVSTAANWFLPMVRDRTLPKFDEHAREEAAKLRQSFDDIERCIDAGRTSTSDLCQAIQAFPDSQLEEEMTLPFGTFTMADILGLHYWNLIYHLGQINQIQLLLGDRAMH